MPSATPNRYQQSTSADKLRGEYYTPAALVDLILAATELPEGAWVVDPSCGDGSFLRGAVAALRARYPGCRGTDLAREWGPRLIGFDANPEAVAAARSNVAAACRTHWGAEPARLSIARADPLAVPDFATLLRAAGLPAGPGPRMVIGNPPYVEAKRLAAPAKRDLAQRFPGVIRGAPDLYLYFLHVCLGWLRPGDSLALVLPNKLLVGANATGLRARLLDERLLRGLWTATRAEVFGGAQVYPLVLFAGGGGAGPIAAARVRREGAAFAAEPLPPVPAGAYDRTVARVLFPPPADPRLWALLDRLLGCPTRLSEALATRWTVSFHRAGLRERFVTRQPGGRAPRPFVGGGAFSGNAEVTRFSLRWDGWWVDYDEAALAAERNHVPPAALFAGPKIAIAQNARTLRAAYDAGGFILKDTFLAGIPQPEHPLGRHPRALVGLLCSLPTHFFFSHVFHGGHVGGGYLHFLGGFLNEIRLGEWTDDSAAETADLVARRETAQPEQWDDLEAAIEERVAAALALTSGDRAALAEWGAADPNWQARGRVGAPRLKRGAGGR
jgi:hypothetical protein